MVSYQDFFKDTLFESGLGMNNMVITMYADNDTIVNGGKVCNMKEIRGTEVYRYFQDNGLNKGLYFQYDDSRGTFGGAAETDAFFPEAGLLCGK